VSWTLKKGVWQLYTAAQALPDEAGIDLFKDDPPTALDSLRRHEVVALVDAGYESVEWRLAIPDARTPRSNPRHP